MRDDELERLIDRELGALPPPRAPRTLLPRILAAVAARPVLPWYRRGWTAWPLAWQLVALVVAVAVSGAIAMAWPHVVALAEAARPDVGHYVPASVRAAAASLMRTLEATRVLWRVLVEPVAVYVVALIVTMSLACVAFGTALNRVALGGPSDL